MFFNPLPPERPSVFLIPSEPQVASDGAFHQKDKETKPFGLNLARFGPGWPAGWPAEGPATAGCFF